MEPSSPVTIQERLARLDWKAIEASLWQRGYAKIQPLLTVEECEAVLSLYAQDEYFRSRIEMRRFRFGEGEYKYFQYPLPSLVQALREQVYLRLVVIAKDWSTGEFLLVEQRPRAQSRGEALAPEQ